MKNFSHFLHTRTLAAAQESARRIPGIHGKAENRRRSIQAFLQERPMKNNQDHACRNTIQELGVA